MKLCSVVHFSVCWENVQTLLCGFVYLGLILKLLSTTIKIELCFYGGLIPLLVSDPQINPFTFKLPRTAPIEEDLTNSPSIFDAPIDEDNTSLVNIANTWKNFATDILIFKAFFVYCIRRDFIKFCMHVKFDLIAFILIIYNCSSILQIATDSYHYKPLSISCRSLRIQAKN